MKICMAVGDFDRAIAVGKEVVGRHPLMTGRFTGNQTKPNTNLMHDLHSVEAKIDMSNTEGIMYVVAHPTTTPLDKDNRIYTMRNFMALKYFHIVNQKQGIEEYSSMIRLLIHLTELNS